MSALSLAADLVRKFEGCKLTAYQDDGGVWTIGYGHTGKDIVSGLEWTQEQAESALNSDLLAAIAAVERLKTRLLTDRQMAALTSLVFNIGAAAFAGSQLLIALNDCRWIDAAHEFIRWDHIGKIENKGLLRRRLTEAALLLEGS